MIQAVRLAGATGVTSLLDLDETQWRDSAKSQQVRDPVLPGRVRLDEKPPPRPLVQAGRHVAPAVRSEPLSSEGDYRAGIGRSGHEVDDRLGR